MSLQHMTKVLLKKVTSEKLVGSYSWSGTGGYRVWGRGLDRGLLENEEWEEGLGGGVRRIGMGRTPNLGMEGRTTQEEDDDEDGWDGSRGIRCTLRTPHYGLCWDETLCQLKTRMEWKPKPYKALFLQCLLVTLRDSVLVVFVSYTARQ